MVVSLFWPYHAPAGPILGLGTLQFESIMLAATRACDLGFGFDRHRAE
jgi:hypothetical protein